MSLKLSTLYVGDLHPEVTESMLAEKFSPAGQIHSVRICRCWKTRASLGYAYVNFYQQPDAERALVTLNCDILMGKPMRVMWCQRDATLRKSGVGNLFVKNLDLTTINSTALYELFSAFGKVLSCKFVTYKKGPKGYGYVQFETQEAANLAQEELDGKLFNNHKISVEHFKSREEREVEANRFTQVFSKKQKEGLDLYVKNLDENINEEFLSNEFSKFGTVTGVKVMMQNDRSRGYGFVQFLSAEEAMKAKEEINGTVMGTKKIFVDVAQRRKDRQNAPVRGNVQKTGKMQTQNVAIKPRKKVESTKNSDTEKLEDPAVEEEPAPTQDPAGEEEPAPTQDPAGEEEKGPLQDAAVEEEPAQPQDPAVEEEPLSSNDPAAEKEPVVTQDQTVEEEPAPTEDLAVEEETFVPQVPAAEEESVLPQDQGSTERPSLSLDKVDMLQQYWKQHLSQGI